jgi:RND family efflux transporter MFP subunit
VNKTFLISLALCLMLAACGRDIEPGRTEAQPPAVRGLTLLTVTATALPEADTFVGTLESPDRSILAARIDGRVGKISVREGDFVQAGQLLLSIEGNPALHRLAEAEGANKAAAAQLILAEQTASRYRQLFAREAVTPQEMDRVSAEMEMARQRQRSAAAAVESARTALDYTRVTAPYAARLVRREVEEGTTVLPGTPLLVLDRQGELRVRAQLPETLFGRVAEGDAVSVEIPAAGQILGGKVAEILPAADPQSRAFEVKVAIALGRDLSAGMYARVGLVGAARPILLVPAEAIVQRGQLSGLYVVEEGILRYRLVRTGRRLDDRVEILSGLAAGATIVATGTEKAQNGARVEQ